MSRRRLERAEATAVRRPKPSGGYMVTADAVVCTRCGCLLPVYADRHLKQIHDAVHRAEGGRQ